MERSELGRLIDRIMSGEVGRVIAKEEMISNMV